MPHSNYRGFYKLSVEQRTALLCDSKALSAEDRLNLRSVLRTNQADKMVENAIGVHGLPLGLGLNLQVNGNDYLVPMAVEEPSIIAAVSSAAKIARLRGGITATSQKPQLIGQVQVVNVADGQVARDRLLEHKDELIAQGNALCANMVARGGGVTDLEVHVHRSQAFGTDMVVVHLIVDTCDAMGANAVNHICEGLADEVGDIAGGDVVLRILSNLADRSMVKARATFAATSLANSVEEQKSIRDNIIWAAELAAVDPYRATTHNKGIMNGIDAVAVATGNDWRAIEASAHAYAAKSGVYRSLTEWSIDSQGDIVGELTLPLKVGTVGGNLQSNPSTAVSRRILGVKSASVLAEVMAAVGLVQNFGALRALASDGIQKGHMKLHARSVALSAGVPDELVDRVAAQMTASGDVKVWKAKEILARLTRPRKPQTTAAIA